jgi:hypothetical protein
MHPIARRINDGGCDEDDQVPLGRGHRLASEETAQERNIPQDRDLVFDLLHFLGNKPAENDGLTVPNNSAGEN